VNSPLGPMPLGLKSQALAYLLKGALHLPERLTNQEMMRSGWAERSVQRSAWVLNSPWGSQIRTQRNGTARACPLCQTAVAETTSTERSSLAYQLLSVMVLQTVEGSSAMTERFGSLSPLRRGLPIWTG